MPEQARNFDKIKGDNVKKEKRRSWTIEEEKFLLKHFPLGKDHKTMDELAVELGRTKRALSCKINVLRTFGTKVEKGRRVAAGCSRLYHPEILAKKKNWYVFSMQQAYERQGRGRALNSKKGDVG